MPKLLPFPEVVVAIVRLLPVDGQIESSRLMDGPIFRSGRVDLEIDDFVESARTVATAGVGRVRGGGGGALEGVAAASHGAGEAGAVDALGDAAVGGAILVVVVAHSRSFLNSTSVTSESACVRA